MKEHAKDNMGLVAQHPYVHDGDLAAQDAVMKEIEANWAESDAEGAALEKLYAGTGAENEYARFVAVREAMTKLQKRILAASRSANQLAAEGVTAAHSADASGARVIIFGALFAIVAAAALAVWITRSVVRPVRALGQRLTSLDSHCLTGLANGLDAVANGDLTQELAPATTPMEVNSTDELGRLATTFNGMLAKAGASRA